MSDHTESSRADGSRSAGNEAARGTALVTGASAGIGRELARVFAQHGFDLVVVARSADALELLAKEIRHEHARAVRVLPCDLTVPGSAQQLFDTLEGEGIQVEVLVNNAGVMEMGGFSETEPEALDRVVELNTRVLTALTRLFLPPMLARRDGRILNVGSVAGFQPVPSMAVYAATKAFVLSLTEALSEELSGSGVSVTALCPGLTVTDMLDKARATSDRASLIPEFLMSDATDVARAGYEACMAGRVIEVPGIGNAVLSSWSRLPPRWLVRSVGGIVGRRFLERQ